MSFAGCSDRPTLLLTMTIELTFGHIWSKLFHLAFRRPTNRRFYARGTRFFPSSNSKLTDREPHENLNRKQPREKNQESVSRIDQNVRYGNETPKELLENAASFRDNRTSRDKQLEDVWNSAPYPKNSNWKQTQARHSLRPKCDPKETSIFLFPGQGTQFVGMGKELLQYPKVKPMFELASSILGYDLLKLCLQGPKEILDQTLYSQPAIVVTSLAALEKLRESHPNATKSCIATAGFSVGEITALAFAQAISFENAIKLVKYRAEAMHLASQITPSGMMTVFYAPDSNVKGACALAKEHCKTLGLENFDCRVANYLYPNCKVVAGNIEALNFIEKHASDFKLRRLKRLPVSGAFHTDLMNPAVEAVKKALKKIPITEPVIKVHSNVDGKTYKNSNHIVMQLPKQIRMPVRWEQTMHILYERNDGQDFPHTFECGPGNSLKAILKMVNAKAATNVTSVGV